MSLLPLVTALLLGFQHALEADHMVAVTTFVAGRPTADRALRFGFRWGLGHSLAVLVFGGVLLVTGLRWPERYDAVGEALVGAMLIGLGAWAIRTARKLHLHPPAEHGDHAHLHAHRHAEAPHRHDHDRHHPPHRHAEAQQGAHAHAHAHAHAGHHDAPSHDGHDEAVTANPQASASVAHPHPHSHGITLVGLMHGLAGTSAVVALVPVTLIGRLDVGLAYLVAFGVGVTLGMMLYASVAAYAMRQAAERSLALGRQLAVLVGCLGMVIGAWWVWGAVRG
jgi:ABC-type nickel/cobalt efflux system permease component RcnA